MAWVVEITGYDFVAPAETTVRFAMGPGLALTDVAYIPSGLLRWVSPSQKIEISQAGVTASRADSGEIQIDNLPNSISEAGPQDALATYAWQGRAASLYWVPGTLWSGKTKVAFGVLQQPGINLAARGEVTSTFRFPLKDPRAVLDVPLQPTKFAGTNSGGTGVEGEADLKGKVKPILYGVASNFPGVRVNAQKLIWQIADKSVTVLCARDGALAWTAGTVRGSLASLQSSTPTPGQYDTYAGSEGTFVRFGSTPIFTVAFDAQEGADAAARTHAQVWNRIRTERCGNVSGDILASSLTDTDALDSNPVGFWWADDISRKDAIDQVLGSLSGYEVLGFDAKWAISRLIAPSGTTKVDLVVLTETLAAKTKTRGISGLDRVRPNFAPDGAPPYRVNVRWGRNHIIMDESAFAGAAVQRLRDKFGQEWRTETATDTAIWNPTTSTGPWTNAPELTVETGYQPGADGLTCPHAATEATRLLALYSSLKGQYQVSLASLFSDQFVPGDVVSLTYPQLALSGGPLFRVLQVGFTLEANRVRTDLVIGLQT